MKSAIAIVSQKARELPETTWIDRLGQSGVALREWRDALISDLGGEESVSTQERSIVEMLSKSWLMLQSVDRFLLEQPSLVNKTRRQLFSIVLQRQQLADSLARNLERLGLKRRAKPVAQLADIIKEHEQQAQQS